MARYGKTPLSLSLRKHSHGLASLYYFLLNISLTWLFVCVFLSLIEMKLPAFKFHEMALPAVLTVAEDIHLLKRGVGSCADLDCAHPEI